MPVEALVVAPIEKADNSQPITDPITSSLPARPSPVALAIQSFIDEMRGQLYPLKDTPWDWTGKEQVREIPVEHQRAYAAALLADFLMSDPRRPDRLPGDLVSFVNTTLGATDGINQLLLAALSDDSPRKPIPPRVHERYRDKACRLDPEGTLRNAINRATEDLPAPKHVNRDDLWLSSILTSEPKERPKTRDLFDRPKKREHKNGSWGPTVRRERTEVEISHIKGIVVWIEKDSSISYSPNDAKLLTQTFLDYIRKGMNVFMALDQARSEILPRLGLWKYGKAS